MKKRVIVVGAGASGMMAAISAARCGAQVTLLEGTAQPGKKLSMTGNGRCNLTNMAEDLAERYHGADGRFASQVVRQFPAPAVRQFFEELGLLTVEKNGYVYPLTGQAASVVEVLLAELDRLHVKRKLGEKVLAIEPMQKRKGAEKTGKPVPAEEIAWQVKTATWQYEADCVILCCGSKCYAATGSDGSGYHLARSLGLKINPVSPALVPLVCEGRFLPGLAGVRCPAEITLYRRTGGALRHAKKGSDRIINLEGIEVKQGQGDSFSAMEMWQRKTEKKNGKIIGGYRTDIDRKRELPIEAWERLGQETGELQWTKYGISGIAVFQLSRHVSREPKGEFRAELNLFPGYEEASLMQLLLRRARELNQASVSLLLRGLLHGKLIPVMLEAAGIPKRTLCGDLTEADCGRLTDTCFHFSLPALGTKSFDACQVCAGGVDTAQVDPATLECRTLPGLYLAGELLDVDGPCGGWNLQWAWSSGYLAGRAAGSEEWTVDSEQ